MVEWMKIEVQQASQEWINTNPLACGGSDKEEEKNPLATHDN